MLDNMSTLRPLYIEYARNYPTAEHRLMHEVKVNRRFKEFVEVSYHNSF